MHSNVTIKNVNWPHFSWVTLYVHLLQHHDTADAVTKTYCLLANFSLQKLT